MTANSSSRAYLNSNSNNVPQDTTSNFFVFQNKVSSRPSLNNTNRSARATAFDVKQRRISGHTTKHAWNASTKAINSSGTVTQNLFGGPQFVKAKGPIQGFVHHRTPGGTSSKRGISNGGLNHGERVHSALPAKEHHQYLNQSSGDVRAKHQRFTGNSADRQR